MGVTVEETFEGKDGKALFARTWRPEGTTRGLVIVHHGFLAHSGLYAWTAQRLAERGFVVYAHDMRGHGKSEGDRFWVDAFSDYVDDLHVFVRLAKGREPGLPTFLFGHSAGGLVACLYALDHQDDIDGLICEAYAFEAAAPNLLLVAVSGLSRLFPRAPVLKLDPKDFSRDPAAVEALRADPLVNHTPGPAHVVSELMAASERLAPRFGEITVPVLILHGTNDNATRPHGSQVFYDQAGSDDKTLKLYDGHFHDLLADVGKEGVLDDLAGWLEAHLPMRATAEAG